MFAEDANRTLWASPGGPQRAVGIFGEHQMVRAEAGADVGELLGLGIVHGEVAPRAREREQLRRRMTRARLAERRVVGRTHGGRDPDAAPLIEHRIVYVVLTGPQKLAAPVGRGLSRRPRARLGAGLAHCPPGATR